jgi:hypothetical protein
MSKFVLKHRTQRPNDALLHLLLSFCFLLLALGSKRLSGPFHQVANNYLGDLFIVGWLYFLVVLVFPRLKPAVTAAIVFTMSAFVEIAQAYGLPLMPGLPDWVLFWSGAKFDPMDMAAYAAGAVLAALINLLVSKSTAGQVPAA